MKIGDTVRFIDPVSKTLREGTLTSLNDKTLVAHVDCTCCGDKVVSLRDTSLDLVRSALTAGKPIDTAAAYTVPFADIGGARKPKPAATDTAVAERPAKARSAKRPLQTPVACQDCRQDFVRTSCVQKRCPKCRDAALKKYHQEYKRKHRKARRDPGASTATAKPKVGGNHSPEHMRQLRIDHLKTPVACLDCKRTFVRSAPSQVRCPPCQGRRLKAQQSAWYQRKKAGLAAGKVTEGTNGTDGTAAATPAPTIAAPVLAALTAPPALMPPVASPVAPPATEAHLEMPMVAHWRAWAVRYRKAAELADELADLIGGAA